MPDFSPGDMSIIYGILAEQWNHGVKKLIDRAFSWVFRWLA